MTRTYEFTISRGYASPDGYNKSVILINNQFPGPLIQANWGDNIEVTVTNDITTSVPEGVTLHWHGQPQKGTPYYDGVPGVEQCPIAPGKTFTYRFQAESYGTSWYHSHYSAQYADGVFGPMVIYGPSNADYDIDIGPVMLTDYYHTTYYQGLQALYEEPPVFLPTDNNLINGKMNYNCSLVTDGTACTDNAGVSKFQFVPGKTHRLRLINSGSAASQIFQIDNHTLTVMALDYVQVEPYDTSVLNLGIGQRADVLVTANQPSGAYWMRTTIDDVNCFPGIIGQPYGLAAIYYTGVDTTDRPNSVQTPIPDTLGCGNDPLDETVPFYSLSPPGTPAVTQDLIIDGAVNATGHLLFYVNNQSFRADYNSPVLLLAQEGNTSYPQDPQWNVYNFGKATSIRLYIQNNFPTVHPMHLHGHDFWVLATGTGTWDGVITNPDNPIRHDTFLMGPGTETAPTYMVIEFNADNPGVWPLHCHIGIHVSAGLYVNVMERPDRITSLLIPWVNAQTCVDWKAYTAKFAPDQIDSGV